MLVSARSVSSRVRETRADERHRQLADPGNVLHNDAERSEFVRVAGVQFVDGDDEAGLVGLEMGGETCQHVGEPAGQVGVGVIAWSQTDARRGEVPV